MDMRFDEGGVFGHFYMPVLLAVGEKIYTVASGRLLHVVEGAQLVANIGLSPSDPLVVDWNGW